MSPLSYAVSIACVCIIFQFGSVHSEKDRGFSIFNIVKFPNSVCSSGATNGTCYTGEECTARGGTAGEECASGFGVCCLFSLACGGTINERQATLTRTDGVTPCTYTVCKASDHVCRIRFDFTTFVIADPGTATTTAAGSTAGQCLTDSFFITGKTSSTPEICGTNTGMHMIVDAADACNMASFITGSATATRNWELTVTQYDCKDRNGLGGPEGCLQYFNTATGTTNSYNFASTATALHLPRQNYYTCFRKLVGMCSICFSPATETVADFGLSVSLDANAAQGAVGSNCRTDFLRITGGATNGALKSSSIISSNRYCGRFFTTKEAGGVKHVTVCTFSSPFRIGFVTDENEEDTPADTATTSEFKTAPTGTIGYKLNFFQRACP